MRKMEYINFAEQILHYMVDISIIFFEIIGLLFMLYAGIRGTIDYIRKSSTASLDLAKGMSMGLQLLMGGEILKTITIGDIKVLIIVGGLVVIRAALAFFIHWEIKGMISENKI